MSKYHPLDVRHPANRARERKTYLLDAPAPIERSQARVKNRRTVTQPAQPVAQERQTLSQAARAVAQGGRFATPWGQKQDRASPSPAPSRTWRRSRFSLGKLVFFGIVILIIARNGGFDALGNLFGALFAEAERIVR
ncbi:MAG: hypothetical protein Kow0013_06000 [Pararhodobacter sp.]